MLMMENFDKFDEWLAIHLVFPTNLLYQNVNWPQFCSYNYLVGLSHLELTHQTFALHVRMHIII